MAMLPFYFSTRRPLAVALFGLTALSGCGGGSGGGGSAPEVKKDTTPPVITLNGANPLAHAYGTQYVELGATAIDAVDGTVDVTVEGGINIDMMNNYTITYTATDKAGNKATEKRTVSVEDLTAPVITLTGGDEVGIVQFDTYQELGGISVDDVDGEVDISKSTTGEVDTSKLGTYSLTYSVTDNAGNASTAERKVTVREQLPFITTWDTTKTSQWSTASDQIKITTNSIDNGGEFTYDYNVDWGDGTTSENLTGDYTHTYDKNMPGYQTGPGVYTVKISGTYPHFEYSEDKRKLLTVEQWGDIHWLSMASSFAITDGITFNTVGAPDLRSVTSMASMFSGAFNFNGDVSHWDTSNVTDMNEVFGGASSFNQDISSWDVSSVTDMGHMFVGATSFNQNLGTWDIKSVKRIGRIFRSAGLSTENYDALLIGWSQVPHQLDVFEVNMGSSTYSNTEEVNSARNILIDTYGWIITDGGAVSP